MVDEEIQSWKLLPRFKEQLRELKLKRSAMLLEVLNIGNTDFTGNHKSKKGQHAKKSQR